MSDSPLSFKPDDRFHTALQVDGQQNSVLLTLQLLASRFGPLPENGTPLPQLLRPEIDALWRTDYLRELSALLLSTPAIVRYRRTYHLVEELRRKMGLQTQRAEELNAERESLLAALDTAEADLPEKLEGIDRQLSAMTSPLETLADLEARLPALRAEAELEGKGVAVKLLARIRAELTEKKTAALTRLAEDLGEEWNQLAVLELSLSDTHSAGQGEIVRTLANLLPELPAAEPVKTWDGLPPWGLPSLHPTPPRGSNGTTPVAAAPPRSIPGFTRNY
jgi:hypothetical protein